MFGSLFYTDCTAAISFRTFILPGKAHPYLLRAIERCGKSPYPPAFRKPPNE